MQRLLPPFFVTGFVVGLGASLTANRAIAAELSEIRDRGYITIAVKNNRAPLSFLTEGGDFSGYEIDIAQRLAAELLGDSSAVRFVPVQNTDRLKAVLDDRVDIAIAAITITPARRRLINFSDPYYLDGTAFITQASTIQTLQNLRLAKVALLNRSSAVPSVRYILPGAQLIGVTSYAEGQRLLNSGSIDAFAGDASVLTSWIPNGSTDYRILDSIITAEPLSVAIPKGTQYTPLKEAINQALRRWYTEGWLQERAAYWGLPAESSQFVNIGPAPAVEPTEEAPIDIDVEIDSSEDEPFGIDVDIDLDPEEEEVDLDLAPNFPEGEERPENELPNIGPLESE